MLLRPMTPASRSRATSRSLVLSQNRKAKFPTVRGTPAPHTTSLLSFDGFPCSLSGNTRFDFALSPTLLDHSEKGAVVALAATLGALAAPEPDQALGHGPAAPLVVHPDAGRCPARCAGRRGPGRRAATGQSAGHRPPFPRRRRSGRRRSPG